MLLYKIYNRINRSLWFVNQKIKYGSALVLGDDLSFRKSFIITIEDGGNIIIGKRCFFNNYCSLNSLECIEIGNDCLFGENVKIYDHNHIYKDIDKPIAKQGFTKKTVKIGNGCWIASNVTILQGITIGNNVVIGANCLICKDVPDNTVVKNSIKVILEKRA